MMTLPARDARRSPGRPDSIDADVDRTTAAAAVVRDLAPRLAFVVALTAMLGSLYYSEIRNFIPCELCWYQRILMYPLVVVLFVASISRDPWVTRYVLPLSVLGFGVATYHYLIQNAVVHSSGFCSAGVSCSVRYVNYLDFITIPFMAQVAFMLITVLMLAAIWGGYRSSQD